MLLFLNRLAVTARKLKFLAVFRGEAAVLVESARGRAVGCETSWDAGVGDERGSGARCCEGGDEPSRGMTGQMVLQELRSSAGFDSEGSTCAAGPGATAASAPRPSSLSYRTVASKPSSYIVDVVDVVRAAPESLLHSSLDSSDEKSLRSAGCSSEGGEIGGELGMVKDDLGLDARMEAERDGPLEDGSGMGGSAWMVFSYRKPTRPRSSLKGIRDEVRRFEDRRLENFGGGIVCGVLSGRRAASCAGFFDVLGPSWRMGRTDQSGSGRSAMLRRARCAGQPLLSRCCSRKALELAEQAAGV